MFSICKDKAKLRDLIKDAISLHVVPDDNAAIDSTDSLKKDGAEYNVQLITDKQEVTVQCKNIHGTIRFVKILEEHKRLDLSGIAEINGQEQKTTELQGHLEQILATNKKFDEHLHEGLNEEDMSDLLDQLDQDIAKDETADLPDVPFNANDLPDVPNTPVNSES